MDIKQRLGFIFDLDGTLVDTWEHYREIWRLLVEEFGTRHDPDVLMGHSARNGLRLMLPELDESEISAIVTRQSAMGRARMQERGIKAQPGVRELVEGLHARGVRLAVATLAECETAEWCLRQVGLREQFEAVIGDSDVTRSKPYPDVYLEALGQLGLRADHCAALEDSPNGIRAAKNAGLRCIAVETTHARAQLLEADWIVEKISDLAPEQVVRFIRGEEKHD